MSKRKEITSYFQPKKKQTTTCEDEEPSAASIEVTGDGVEPLIFGGINRNILKIQRLLMKNIIPVDFKRVGLINFLGRCGSNTFTVKGFNSWRKVNNGKDCAFRCHVRKGDGSNSAHNFAAKCYYNLKNQPCHLEKIVEKQSAEEIKRNRMCLKTSIDAIKWLTFQACAFRGHDESCNSKNQGNFLEMLKLLASYNPQVEEIILDKAPKNAKYTSPKIQKELLHVFARKVQDLIRDEIDDAKYCLIVDESRDISKREQMAIVVSPFCERHTILIPDMNAPYFDVLKSLRRQGKQKQMVTMEHHYRVEIFTAVIDQQLHELNNRFSEQMTELLILSASLNPRDGYRSFNIENICKLAEKFYPEDFLGDEKIHLQCELQHYGLDVPVLPDLKNLSTLGDLCHGLVITGKADMYPLVDRLLRLVLTLPASTATSERAFSAMKIVKTSLRNRMEDEFLRDYLIVYIEKEIAETISTEEIIDSFYLIKERRAHLK
ncbi:TTF-type domain-containing protein [Heracleum sosnowskyi]|uniref:TTF-type domain-containing protein n=1 Tax=Heracleum sosnowskyi TaxID=360622 RepID=A0AAD8IME6_9APIA|nr:TTF-type domain-containing protein [Heracleum sosnowskyi]